jgi:hypothetical protein
MLIGGFAIRRVATSGHEICDPNGRVVAWTVDEPWALLIAFLLNRVETEGLWRMVGAGGEGDTTPRQTRLGLNCDPR